MAGVPFKKNQAADVYLPGLVSQAETDIFQVNPTIAAGDFKISKDGGALANPDTIPAVTPAGSTIVKIALTDAELDANCVVIKANDVAGDEWCDAGIVIYTDTAQVGEINTNVQVLAAVVAMLNDPSAAVIADGVWDELRAAHVIAGSFGAVGEWTNVPAGAGTTPLEVTVTDGTNPLDGAEVDVTLTAVHTAPVASGYTDAFGKVTFHLDPGTYYIWVQHSGYNGTNPTAKVVA